MCLHTCSAETSSLIFSQQTKILLSLKIKNHGLTWYIAFLISNRLSTRAIFKFRKLRSLLEIAQKILIVQHLGQWDWGLILMGECLGLNLCGHHGKLPGNLHCVCAKAQWESPYTFPYKQHFFEQLPGQNLAKYHEKAKLWWLVFCFWLWYPKKALINP